MSMLPDRYQIERELGTGGMATVYAARDLRHDRLVAVKILRADVWSAASPLRSEAWASPGRTSVSKHRGGGQRNPIHSESE